MKKTVYTFFSLVTSKPSIGACTDSIIVSEGSLSKHFIQRARRPHSDYHVSYIMNRYAIGFPVETNIYYIPQSPYSNHEGPMVSIRS